MPNPRFNRSDRFTQRSLVPVEVTQPPSAFADGTLKSPVCSAGRADGSMPGEGGPA